MARGGQLLSAPAATHAFMSAAAAGDDAGPPGGMLPLNQVSGEEPVMVSFDAVPLM